MAGPPRRIPYSRRAGGRLTRCPAHRGKCEKAFARSRRDAARSRLVVSRFWHPSASIWGPARTFDSVRVSACSPCTGGGLTRQGQLEERLQGRRQTMGPNRVSGNLESERQRGSVMRRVILAMGLALAVTAPSRAEQIYGLTNLQQLVTFDSVDRSVTSTGRPQGLASSAKCW